MLFKSKTFKYISRLLKILPNKRRTDLISLIPVAIFSGVADVFVVFLVARMFNSFVGIPNDPSVPFSDALDLDPKTKILGLILLYVSSTWVASIVKLFLKACQFKLKSQIWRDLSEICHRKILNQDYEYFISTSRDNISASVLTNVDRVSEIVVLPLLQCISGSFVVLFISIAVLLIAKNIALILIISMLIGFSAISLTITPFLKKAAKKRIEIESKTNFILQESMKTILDVQLTNSEPFFEQKYKFAGRKSIPFIWRAQVLPEFPRALLEPFGISMIFIVGLLPFFIDPSNNQNFYEIIPFLGTIAVASLKLTPPLQDAFRAYTSLRAGLPDLIATLKIVELPEKRLTLISESVPSPKKLIPKKIIELINIYYKYPSTKNYVLKNININIPVGSKIAFVGKTGSGKTTAANILLGLLKQSRGSILVDNLKLRNIHIPSWQALGAYVPQTINLLNNDIIHNVAFGIEDKNIDIEKVWESIKAAQLEELVLKMPNNIYTNLGDNGIQISGGQRQRLAIARALYRDAKFIILDEATSSLDNKTESEVMGAIENISKRCTIVIIAHRLSTVIQADNIYEFSQGEIKAFGNFRDLQEKSDSFRQLTNYEKYFKNDKHDIF